MVKILTSKEAYLAMLEGKKVRGTVDGVGDVILSWATNNRGFVAVFDGQGVGGLFSDIKEYRDLQLAF